MRRLRSLCNFRGRFKRKESNRRWTRKNRFESSRRNASTILGRENSAAVQSGTSITWNPGKKWRATDFYEITSRPNLNAEICPWWSDSLSPPIRRLHSTKFVKSSGPFSTANSTIRFNCSQFTALVKLPATIQFSSFGFIRRFVTLRTDLPSSSSQSSTTNDLRNWLEKAKWTVKPSSPIFIDSSLKASQRRSASSGHRQWKNWVSSATSFGSIRPKWDAAPGNRWNFLVETTTPGSQHSFLQFTTKWLTAAAPDSIERIPPPSVHCPKTRVIANLVLSVSSPKFSLNFAVVAILCFIVRLLARGTTGQCTNLDVFPPPNDAQVMRCTVCCCQPESYNNLNIIPLYLKLIQNYN